MSMIIEKNFEEQIKKELDGLGKQQIIFLAWLCAVRTLPFLGVNGNFNFWKNKKNIYLYNILYAIDISAIYNYDNTFTYNVFSPDTYADVNDFAIYSAIYTAETAADIVIYMNIFDDNFNNKTISSYIKNIVETANYAIPNAKNNDIYLNNILLNDIKYIKNDEFYKLNNNLNIYGDIWTNFQKALKDIGCGYWGKLYENIFKNKFQQNIEDIKLRLFKIPEEIKEQGAAAVAAYLEKLEEGSENLNEARIIILGEKGAGKTCLARRLINPDALMTKTEESTIGVETTIWKISSGNNSVNTHIWDFAGHVITHAAHSCFLSERCMYIIVYNGRTETENRLTYWLDHVKNYGGNAPVRILINKFDDHKPKIPENTLKDKYPFIKDFVYFSINNDKYDLEKFRSDTSDLILGNPLWNHLQIPADYYNVKKSLEKCFFTEGKDFIDKTDFNITSSKFEIYDEERERLLNDLHLLGICFWYEKIKNFNMLILNPDWITNGIYKAINWAHNNSKDTIELTDYEKIFGDEKGRYPADKFRFIFKLMEEYKLAYSKGEDRITVPHLLKEDRPNELPIFLEEESLTIKYISEATLPPNIVCRLIVKHHNEIRNDDEVWQLGVVLKYGDDTVAMVIEDDRTITINVQGSEKTKYITILRDSMKDIFINYKSDTPELHYRIIVPDELKPQFNPKQREGFKTYQKSISEQELLNHIKYNRPIYDSNTNIDIPVATTVKEYNIKPSFNLNPNIKFGFINIDL